MKPPTSWIGPCLFLMFIVAYVVTDGGEWIYLLVIAAVACIAGLVYWRVIRQRPLLFHMSTETVSLTRLGTLFGPFILAAIAIGYYLRWVEFAWVALTVVVTVYGIELLMATEDIQTDKEDL